jgi:hypothetical protein
MVWKKEPDGIFKVPLVKLKGGNVTSVNVKVKAHGIEHVKGELPNLNISPATQAFVTLIRAGLGKRVHQFLYRKLLYFLLNKV